MIASSTNNTTNTAAVVLQQSTKPHLIFRLEVFLTPYTQDGYFAYIGLKILQLEAFLSPGE